MNTYVIMSSRDIILSAKVLFVSNQATTIAAHIEESLVTASMADEIDSLMEQIDITGITYVIITDAYGIPVFVSDGSYVPDELPMYDIMMSIEGRDIVRPSFSGGIFSTSAITPIDNRGAFIGAVYIRDNDREQGDILMDMQLTLGYVSIMVAALSVLAVAIIIWSVMRRVTSIVKAVKSVREGEYGYHITMSGNDELAILGDEFNNLSSRLRETEEVRRRFVADASHELRTPLASIRLLSDSILQNADIDINTVHEFISDIGQEAERLARTTERLMDLTKLDSKIQDERVCVDMKETIIATMRMLTPLAKSNNLSIRSELSDGCNVFATEDAIHQIVFNLVENAIKYNQPDGMVTVSLAIVDKTVVLNVDDRGVGIPVEDIPHIFDRFYRVEKARSRAAGGSGLGLAIVSDTVRELGGRVSAIRRVGGGMRFQVRFPLYEPDGLLI
jgi:signal transduction histidine kinase